MLSNPPLPLFCQRLCQCCHLSTCLRLPLARLVITWLLVVPQPLDAPLPFDAPSGCCVASCCAALSFWLLHRFLPYRLCHSTRPPPLFDVSSPHLVLVPLTPFCLLLRIPHPPPAGFSFGCWTPADEWTKMGALLGFWLGGGMWCIFNSPEKKINRYNILCYFVVSYVKYPT